MDISFKYGVYELGVCWLVMYEVYGLRIGVEVECIGKWSGLRCYCISVQHICLYGVRVGGIEPVHEAIVVKVGSPLSSKC